MPREIINLPLPTANKEEMFRVPDYTTNIHIESRNGNIMKMGFIDGSVDGVNPPGPYKTIKTNGLYFETGVKMEGGFIYLSSPASAEVAEIVIYTSGTSF